MNLKSNGTAVKKNKQPISSVFVMRSFTKKSSLKNDR
jgi:hypothetical protein